jgi:hypothetical protein
VSGDAYEHYQEQRKVKAVSTVSRPDYKPADSENSLEKGSYPSPGEGTEGGGGTNHRALPTPSKEGAGRGVNTGKGVMGEGRGSSGKFDRTITTRASGPAKAKGCMGY